MVAERAPRVEHVALAGSFYRASVHSTISASLGSESIPVSKTINCGRGSIWRLPKDLGSLSAS